MDCTGVKAKLIDLAYGELNPAEDRAAREHCARCESCARELAELTETLELTRRAPEPELPPFLNARVLAHVREEVALQKKPARRWAWIFRPQAAMAAVAMIAASVVIVIAAERGLEPRRLQPQAAALQEKDLAPIDKTLDADAELKGRGEGADEMMAMPAPAEAPATSALGEPAPEPAPAEPRLRQAPADELQRETIAPGGRADEPRLAGDNGFLFDAAQGAPAPAYSTAQPAPAPAPAAPPPANQAAGAGPAAPRTAGSSSGGGLLGFRAKSVAPPELAVGSAAPVSGATAPKPTVAPSAPATAAAPASTPAPAPSAPAETRFVAKSLEMEEAAPEEMKDEAAPAKPDPQALLASAKNLEQEKKWAEALAAYQRAATALGYVAGNEKQPPCSPLLKEALAGTQRCQRKLGKLTAARATAQALAAICPPETK